MKKIIIYFIFIFPLIAGTTGKIRGRVIDSITKEPLIGTNVYLASTNYGSSTDLEGTFLILNVPPGQYELVASMIGYDNYKVLDLEVNLDLTTTVNIELNESSLELESVVINAKKDLINRNLTSTTAIITKKSISKLPVNEVSDLLDLQAGYVDGHLRGGRSSEVAYWIDGMPMTDGYDGSTVINVSKDAIREMQLISGSFNAEYGQAMSGIVNITTNEGSNDFGGSIDLYTGDYLSNHKDLYLNIDNFNLSTTKNVSFNIHGSIIKNKLFYYLSTRNIDYYGPYEGQKKYNPYSYGLVMTDANTDEKYWHVLGSNLQDDLIVNDNLCNSPLYNCGNDFSDEAVMLTQAHSDPNPLGSQKFVSMDWNKKKYGQLNLIWKPTQTFKVKYTHFTDDVEFQEYNRFYKLNPDGDLLRFRKGSTNLLQLNKSINLNSFFTVGFIKYNKMYRHRSFNSLSEYPHQRLGENQPDDSSFSTGGANQNMFERETMSETFKFDYTNQINNSHQIKFGFTYKIHSIFYQNINLQYYVDGGYDPIYDSPFVLPTIDDISSPNTSIYTFKPEESSVYVQDKIELNELIINVGMRFDYFDPKGQLLADPEDPFIYDPIKPEYIYDCSIDDGFCGDNEDLQSLDDRLEYWYVPTKQKSMISPRLGASFPIFDRGVFHFSYGHFFQIPKFELLYHNADINLDRGGNANLGVIGNPDLEPEKTVSYEVGIQYKLDKFSAIDMTMYFRDIRDLTGTRTDAIITHNGATYFQYENSDYAFVKGLVISYKKNFMNGISATIDYTFQQAKGTASDPYDAYNSFGSYPEIHVIPLDWDQTHTLNSTLYYDSKYWGAGVITKIGSGQPYTPSANPNSSNLVTNSRTKPLKWNIDLRSYFLIPSMKKTKFYINIFNVFDNLNHLNVYDDTGRADVTKYEQQALLENYDELINSINDWYDNETFYSSPRRIEIGCQIEFN